MDSVLALTKADFLNIAAPLLEVCKAVTPALLAIIGSLGAIWCIFLGTKFSTAIDPQEHEKAKKALINAIIGYVLIFVLVLGLHLASESLVDWYETYI